MGKRSLSYVLALLFLCASPARAVTCPEVEYSADVRISVAIEETDDDPRKVLVSAPSVVFGKSLSWVYLWVRSGGDTEQLNLQIPLQFDVDGPEAHAEFFARRNWNAVEITAHYGDQVCDPQLELSLWR